MTIPLLESEALTGSIARMKEEQKNMKDAKNKLTKDLKNAEKRRSRLKKRARALSDADLVAVLQMRGTVAQPENNSSSSSTALDAQGEIPPMAGVADDEH